MSYADQNDIDGETRLMGTYVDMGADEINPDCDDVYNAYDWNADGIVNLYEFNAFSKAWLSRDPNDPTLPSDPNLIDPNEFINWDSRCDLNQNYRVDLPDILLFADDNIWLWVACWRTDIQEMQQQMSMLAQSGPVLSGVERIERPVLSEVEEMASPVPSISMEISPPVETTVSVPMTESVEAMETDPAAQREQVLLLLEEIDALIDAGNDDTEAWWEIKNLLEQTLAETEDTTNEPNDF